MIKALLSIGFILVGVYIFMWIAGFYDRTARPHNPLDPVPEVQVHAPVAAGADLPGLPPYLETALAEAQQGGQEELGKWLKHWSRHVQDPRLAWIELDYVVLLNLKSHTAARDYFRKVQSRIGPESPVYDRLSKLAPAYEN